MSWGSSVARDAVYLRWFSKVVDLHRLPRLKFSEDGVCGIRAFAMSVGFLRSFGWMGGGGTKRWL